MKVKDFVQTHWLSSTPTAYLHQWQFPLTANKVVRDILCEENEEMEILGLDLLQFYSKYFYSTTIILAYAL
jgi:hypothetical protein